MVRIPKRVTGISFTSAALAIAMAACSDQPTGPSQNFEARQNIVLLSSSYIVDTGPGTGGTSTIGTLGLQNCCGTIWQFLGGQFTIADEANIERIEGWMKAGTGTINVHIRNDASNLPGTDVVTQAYSVTADTEFGWKQFALTVTLQPGTYWVTFEPSATFIGNMSGGAANPLSRYAYNSNPDGAWHAMSTALGIRVFGSINTAPALIAALRTYVAGAGLSRPVASKIDGSLQKASDALNANNTAAACTNLQDVVDYVIKQSVRKIPASVKTEILSETSAIQTAVGC